MVEALLRVSKSFVIDADAVKVYDVARDFFIDLGYDEQNTVRPTLLELKRRIFKNMDSSKNINFRISLKVTLSPLGNLRIYSTSLVTVRCDYDVKITDKVEVSKNRAFFENEVERLRCQIIKLLHTPVIAPLNSKSCAIIAAKQEPASVKDSSLPKIQAKLIQREMETRIGENVNPKIFIKNVGDTVVFVKKVEKLIPAEFQPVSIPENSSIEDMQIIMKDVRLAPREKNELEVVLKSTKKGTFEVKPMIIFSDEEQNVFPVELKTISYRVLDKVLPNRITTGSKELDTLLFGGIPEKYAVLLASSSNNEREQIIKRFLTAGAESGQATYYIAIEPGKGKKLAEKFQQNFYLFLCNPQANLMVDNLPNIFKLSGVENLSEIDIALTKSFRLLDESKIGPRRACIEIISDVLLQHHAVITRKWLCRLLPELKSKGFTTLAIVNPHMHPREEIHALLGLFEGEINIAERETAEGLEKSLRINKLYNQPYLEKALILNKVKIESGTAE